MHVHHDVLLLLPAERYVRNCVTVLTALTVQPKF